MVLFETLRYRVFSPILLTKYSVKHAFISSGGPGSATRVVFPFSIRVTGAQPSGLGKHEAPFRERAIFAMTGRSSFVTPSRSAKALYILLLISISTPKSFDKDSIVKSSEVGPKPPVKIMKSGFRLNAALRAVQISVTTSGTQVILCTSAPSRVIWSAIQKEFVSYTLPKQSSFPIAKISTRTPNLHPLEDGISNATIMASLF